ncbi:MAG: hypothetical protein U1F57_08195 [bacterium]
MRTSRPPHRWLFNLFLLCGICVSFPPFAEADTTATTAQAHASKSHSMKRRHPGEGRANFSLSLEVDQIKDGGTVGIYEFFGEYAVHPRFWVGFSVPFWSIRGGLLPSNDHLGDIGLHLKGVIWKHKHPKLALDFGSSFYFPTGNADESLGAGVTVADPFLNLSYEWKRLSFYQWVEGSFQMAEVVNPSLLFETGMNVILIRGALPLHFLLSLQGSTFFVNDKFRDKTTQLYIFSGLSLDLTRHWSATLAGKALVSGDLSLKPNLDATDTATGLLSDVKVGFLFNLGYSF